MRWGGIIMYIIIIYRLNKNEIQGDQMPPFVGLAWILDEMTLHKRIRVSRMAFVTNTLFKWTVCSSDVFYELQGLFLYPEMSFTQPKRGQRLTDKLHNMSQKWAEQFTRQQLKGEDKCLSTNKWIKPAHAYMWWRGTDSGFTIPKLQDHFCHCLDLITQSSWKGSGYTDLLM